MKQRQTLDSLAQALRWARSDEERECILDAIQSKKTRGYTGSDVINHQPITNLDPHYTNDHYATPRTVWLASGCKADPAPGGYEWVKDATYNYSDRIWQWDWNKADAITKTIEGIDRRSSAYIQEFLRRYFDAPTLELVHILAGFNVSTGYPYQVYGYVNTIAGI